MTGRLGNVKAAVRPLLKARLMLSGPAGAGKTFSALEIAQILADKGRVLVIDTEKESALTYADEFPFDHLPWQEPFDPRELRHTLIEAAEQYAVIVVDSLTHFWHGPLLCVQCSLGPQPHDCALTLTSSERAS